LQGSLPALSFDDFRVILVKVFVTVLPRAISIMRLSDATVVLLDFVGNAWQNHPSLCHAARFSRLWHGNPYDLGENNQVEFPVAFNPPFVGDFFSPSGEQIIDAGVATHESLQDHAVNSFAEVLSLQNVT
jgi:hypothetical protein